jgi:beta-lactamase class A
MVPPGSDYVGTVNTGARQRLRQAWDARLAGVDGTVSLDLRSGAASVAARLPESPHYAASTIKLAVLAAVVGRPAFADQAASARLPVRDTFPSVAGGSFRLRQADDQDDQTWVLLGSEAPLSWLAERMITHSGNLATDLIADYLGLAAVREFLEAAGLGGSIVVDRLIGDVAAEAAGVTNVVTASGLARLMAGIADHSLLAETAGETALSLLARQTHRRMIPAGLPPGTWSASKSGWVPGVKHDVALVRPDSAPPYVLAVCTTTGVPDTEGEELVAGLSAITWEHWTRWHA